MTRTTLHRTSCRKQRLLARFRHLAFECLHDRITLDASGVLDGEIVDSDDSAAETETEVSDAGQIEILVIEDSGEAIDGDVGGEEEGELFIEDEFVDDTFVDDGRVYDETLVDETLVDENGEVIDDLYWEEFTVDDGRELTDPNVWEPGVDDEFIMYTMMDFEPTGEEIPSEEVISEEVPIEETPGDVSEEDGAVSGETTDGEFVKWLPSDEYVLSAEGEYLPFSAVQRTLTDSDPVESDVEVLVSEPTDPGLDPSVIFETTVVDEPTDPGLDPSVILQTTVVAEPTQVVETPEVISPEPIEETAIDSEISVPEEIEVTTDVVTSGERMEFWLLSNPPIFAGYVEFVQPEVDSAAADLQPLELSFEAPIVVADLASETSSAPVAEASATLELGSPAAVQSNLPLINSAAPIVVVPLQLAVVTAPTPSAVSSSLESSREDSKTTETEEEALVFVPEAITESDEESDEESIVAEEEVVDEEDALLEEESSAEQEADEVAAA